MLRLRSKWYRPPSLARLKKGKSTAAKLTWFQWQQWLENPAKYGIYFPYRSPEYGAPVPMIDMENG